MNKLKNILLGTIIVLICNGCIFDNSKVLVGYETVSECRPPGNKCYSDNNQIISVTKDSIEFIPLYQGCILSPSGKNKFKLFKSRFNGKFVATEEDTVQLNFQNIGHNMFKYRFERTEFIYLSTKNVKLNLSEKEIVKSFKDNSFVFSVDNLTTTLSFYENEKVIINKKEDFKETIEIAYWSIKEVEGNYFLTLDNQDEISKFQLLHISNDEIKLKSFNDKRTSKIIMSKILNNHRFDLCGTWKLETNNRFDDNEDNQGGSTTLTKYWLSTSEYFIVNDTITINNVVISENQSNVFIDWPCRALIGYNSIILGVERDIINGKKIHLFSTNENGKRDNRISKTFILK